VYAVVTGVNPSDFGQVYTDKKVTVVLMDVEQKVDDHFEVEVVLVNRQHTRKEIDETHGWVMVELLQKSMSERRKHYFLSVVMFGTMLELDRKW